MLKEDTTIKGMVHTKEYNYTPDIVKGIPAEKKQQIVDIMTEGTQLTLMATILDQLIDLTGLDTPEAAAGKETFAAIKTILDTY